MIRISLFFLVYFTAMISVIHAQRANHKSGEIIVETQDERSFLALFKDISAEKQYRQSAKYEKVAEMNTVFYKITLDTRTIDEEAFLTEIILHKHTLTAQKNHIIEYRKKPNDPQYAAQWQFLNVGNLDIDLDAEEAWDYTTGGVTAQGDTIVVAVIDDGYDQEHEDFQGNIWYNHGEIPDNGIDDDNNGYVDDYAGYSAYNDTDDVSSNPFHGSSVAGIIGARGDNGIGVAGVNWKVKLMMIQGGGDEVDALKAYAYAYNMRKRYNESNGSEGAFVVATNASWGTDGGKPADAPIWCDFYNTMGDEGIISCGATTNQELDVEVAGDLPTGCASPYLIGVTNINDADEKVTAGYGYKSIDLGAYGEDAFTIRANNNYGGFGGTSGATPHVTGAVALLYSVECENLISLAKANPGKAALAVKDFILNGAVPIDALAGITTTGGKLNLLNAVRNADNICQEVCRLPYGIEINVSGFDEVEILYEDDTDDMVEVRYRKDGSTEWSRATLTASGDKIPLDFCTIYEFQVGKQCGDNLTYGYSRFIESGGCCYAPDIVDLSFDEGIPQLTWNLNEAYTDFLIQYKTEDMDAYLDLTAEGDQNTITLPVVVESCSYIDINFKSLCGVIGSESKFLSKRFYSDCGSCQADYCSDFSGLDNAGEWISNFTIEEVFSRTSGKENESYFYDGNSGIILKDSTTYTFSLDVKYGSDTYDERLAIYLDQNYDGIFANDERVYYKSQFRNSITDTFHIPKMATYGNTRMRVIMMFDPIGGACKSDDQRYGEVEDYCVEVQSVYSCPTEIALSTTVGYYDTEEQNFVIDTNAVVSIEIDGYSELYSLEYRKTGDPTFTKIESEENTFNLFLERCMTYELQLTARCNDEEFIESQIIPVRAKCYNSSTNDPLNRTTKIYPNPGTSFKIESENRIDKVVIYTITGAKKLTVENQRFVDAGHLAAGIYLVEIMAEGRREVHKWVKN